MHIKNVWMNASNRGDGVPSVSRVANSTSVLLMSLAFAVLLLSAGCVSGPAASLFQEPIGDYRNHVWANRAYNFRHSNCDREFEDHFKQGFIDGYQDVCDGGDGYVPAVPPEDYWGFKFQTPEGAKCVNTWFKAYPLGVKAAREDRAGAFNKVYISKMIKSAVVQDEADNVLPEDVPVVAPKDDVSKKLPVNPFVTDPSFMAHPANQRTADSFNNANYNK